MHVPALAEMSLTMKGSPWSLSSLKFKVNVTIQYMYVYMYIYFFCS